MISELKSVDVTARQEATIAQLQKEIKALTATVEKVSDQLELGKRAAQCRQSLTTNLSPSTSTTNKR